MKLSKKYNLMFIPHEQKMPRQARLPLWLLILLSIVGIGIIVGITWVIIGYTLNMIDLGSMDKVKRDVAVAEKKIEIMQGALNQMKDESQKLDLEKQKLESMHTLENDRRVPRDDNALEKTVWDDAELDALLTRINSVDENINVIEQKLKDQKSLNDTLPTKLPASGYLVTDYGNVLSPFTGKVQYHYGIDIVAERGTPIYAAGSGVVTKSDVEGGYGLVVEISHGNSVSSRYCHNLRNVVAVGDKVRRGDLIAYMGNTGQTTGTHLHFEIRVNNQPVDPKRFILNDIKDMDGNTIN
jgi:murein DD-endopeptidase MepM/ murein hydrolase activator NlpD